MLAESSLGAFCSTIPQRGFFTLAARFAFAENFLCSLDREMRKPSKGCERKRTGKPEKISRLSDLQDRKCYP